MGFNNAIIPSKFPSILELADITPVFTKDERKLIILPKLSNKFEIFIFDQIYQSMPHLSKQRGFRNKYRTHHYLLATLEKLKEGKEGTLFSYCRKEGTLLSFMNRLNKIC